MNNKILDDFSFVLPKKSERYKNVKPESVDFNRLSHEYCLSHFFMTREGISNGIVDLNALLRDKYSGMINGNVLLNGGDDAINNIFINDLKCIINKKVKMFEKLMNYHLTIFDRKEDAGMLSFSIFLLKKHDDNVIAFSKFVKKNLTDFLNNIRSVANFRYHVIGYFWCVLKSSDDMPYIHVNFYLDTKEFNNLIGYEINRVWIKTLDKNNVHGGIVHFTITENYVNGLLFKTTGYDIDKHVPREFRGFRKLEQSGKPEGIVFKDINGNDSMLLKIGLNSVNAKPADYILSLSKESYFLDKNSRVFGVSMIKQLIIPV